MPAQADSLTRTKGLAEYPAAISPKSRCRVLMLPPIPWLPSRSRHLHNREPDQSSLERSLASLGIDVTILDPTTWPWNPAYGRHPLFQGIDLLRAIRVLLFYRHWDAIVCVFEGPSLVLALLRRIMWFRPRLLMWDLGLIEGWAIRKRILDIVMPRLDGVLVLGSNQPALIAARWRPHAPVYCVGHYIDVTFWQLDPRSIGKKGGYILSVGDDIGRDYNILLNVVGELDCELVVRSGRTLTLDPHRHQHVRQLRSRCSFPELRELYAGASLVVVPLHDLPTAGGVSAILEAAAMGCAMVVSDSTGIRDWLRDGETCLVVPCGDTLAMAVAVRRLLADPVFCRQLGQAARAFIVESCAPDVFARRLAEGIASVVS